MQVALFYFDEYFVWQANTVENFSQLKDRNSWCCNDDFVFWRPNVSIDVRKNNYLYKKTKLIN